MKLIYRILLRLSLALLAVLTVWTVFFYFTMIDEINDEVDDALEDYSETDHHPFACRQRASFEKRRE